MFVMAAGLGRPIAFLYIVPASQLNLIISDLMSFRQVTFESGLQAFEQEGVQKVTTLKDDLVKAQHAQSPAIIRRNDELVQR